MTSLSSVFVLKHGAHTYGDFVAGRPLTLDITVTCCPVQARNKGQCAEKLSQDFTVQEKDAKRAVALGAEADLSRSIVQ